MDDLQIALRFAVALGLGVFLGLERERRKDAAAGFAGVRTFALIALSGALAAYFQIQLSMPWIALPVCVAVVGLVVSSYIVTASRGDVGATTEVAAILAFALGALCVHGDLTLAASLAVVIALVLSMRDRLHALAHNLSGADVEATLKFAIIALIVLPLVPDRTFGTPPFDVVNPYRIWLMIVLISAVDFASYVLVKVAGPEHGTGITGLLGGLVSSTALTLGLTRKSRESGASCAPLALGIVLAWSVMFVRVIVLTGTIAPALFGELVFDLGLPTLVALAIAFTLWRRGRHGERASVAAGENPFELSQAVKFGLLFAVVTVIAKLAQNYLGTSGLYAAGALAGTTDVDAIALAMADRARYDPESVDIAARTIEIAVFTNTVVKGVMTLVLGSQAMRKTMLPIVVILAVACMLGIVVF